MLGVLRCTETAAPPPQEGRPASIGATAPWFGRAGLLRFDEAAKGLAGRYAALFCQDRGRGYEVALLGQGRDAVVHERIGALTEELAQLRGLCLNALLVGVVARRQRPRPLRRVDHYAVADVAITCARIERDADVRKIDATTCVLFEAVRRPLQLARRRVERERPALLGEDQDDT